MKRKSDNLSPYFETIKKPTIYYNFVFQIYYYNKYSFSTSYTSLKIFREIVCIPSVPGDRYIVLAKNITQWKNRNFTPILFFNFKDQSNINKYLILDQDEVEAKVCLEHVCIRVSNSLIT